MGELANSFVLTLPFCFRVGVSWQGADVGDNWLEFFLLLDELLTFELLLLALLLLVPLLFDVEYLSLSSLRLVDFEWGGELTCVCDWAAAVVLEATIIRLLVEDDSLLLEEEDDDDEEEEAITDEEGAVKIVFEEPFKFACWLELLMRRK